MGVDPVVELADLGDSIDMPTFEQILEMDEDDEEKEFSKSIVYGFFEQTETTLVDLANALSSKDLDRLSSLGHYLKGSSATLGLTHMRNSCEKIQHLGSLKDESGLKDKDETYCLAAIKTEIKLLKIEYVHVESALRKFFGEESKPEK